MKPRYAFAGLFFLAGFACAQTLSSHSGWNFSDTLETATDVLVADIVSGSAVDNGSQVSVKATVRVVRVLAGGTIPGMELALAWQYQPVLAPSATAKVPAVRALWFLREKADGSFEPLQASGMIVSMGGVYVEIPEAGPPAAFVNAADQLLQAKIAREVAWALEDLVARHAADLGPHPPEPPVAGVVPPWVRTQMQFDSLEMMLHALDQRTAADVFQYLSERADANLKLLGIAGRLRAGDANALFELEKDLPRLAASFGAMRVSPSMMGIDLRENLPAAHAWARMALAEQTIPGMDGIFAMQVGSTHSLEFLPYLMVMAGSSAFSARDAALMSMCGLLAPPQLFWQPEMSAYCPNRSPMNDSAEAQKDVAFWQRWWDAHREEIGKLVELPSVVPPARYSANVGAAPAIEVPMEVRFQGVLGPGGEGVQLSAADRETFQKVAAATNARLAGNQQRSMDVMNAARLRGTLPDRQSAAALWQDRLAILKAGLADMRSKLSPEGWQAVEHFMMSMGFGAAGAPAQPPK
ncbi:MAG: hypothetical protein LAP87_10515 [Acidobacteriia bacterium]|nr:hypothetical protein [Terriglobia bacterium]